MPQAGTFAPTARNILSAPGTANWDMSFAKFIPIGEGWRIEIRADSFNTFNHTQFMNVGTSFTTPAAFGRVTSAKNPRFFMIGARIEY